MMNLKFLLCVLVVMIAGVCGNYYKEFTVTVAAGTDTCFYHFVKDGQVIDLEYQVIDGGHGDLDINFQLSEPTGRVLNADFKKSENVHRVEVKVEGDYKFCFDNTFSSYNSKVVFFELIVENPNESGGDSGGDEDWNDDINADFLEGLTKEEVYDIRIQDIHDAVSKVRTQLTKVQHLQDLIRSFEARDRNVAEENFYKVNIWSIFQIFIMGFVGFIQVVMVKSLFDEKSSVHKFLKKLKH